MSKYKLVHERRFECPGCGAHTWGGYPKRSCNGGYAGCGFQWHEKDDSLYIKDLYEKIDEDSELTDTDKLAIRHSEVLEENNQLRARFNEQCRIIEDKRETIQEIRHEMKGMPLDYESIIEKIDKLEKLHLGFPMDYYYVKVSDVKDIIHATKENKCK